MLAAVLTHVYEIRRFSLSFLMSVRDFPFVKELGVLKPWGCSQIVLRQD
jgi:hypothetical protein